MMGSKLLSQGDTERGFSGIVNRQFEHVRNLYTRLLSGTLRYQPVVLTLWVIVALLMIPFYMFSQRELAPAEDQGIVFSIIQSPANSTLDQTNLFSQQVYDVFHSVPESESIFEITQPSGGFGGMVTKPWSERKKTAQELLMQAFSGPLSKIPGHSSNPIDSVAVCPEAVPSRLIS